MPATVFLLPSQYQSSINITYCADLKAVLKIVWAKLNVFEFSLTSNPGIPKYRIWHFVSEFKLWVSSCEIVKKLSIKLFAKKLACKHLQ
jgi:hypothetical protein